MGGAGASAEAAAAGVFSRSVLRCFSFSRSACSARTWDALASYLNFGIVRLGSTSGAFSSVAASSVTGSGAFPSAPASSRTGSGTGTGTGGGTGAWAWAACGIRISIALTGGKGVNK